MKPHGTDLVSYFNGRFLHFKISIVENTGLLVLISVRESDDPRSMVWLGILGQLKNSTTSSGIEAATF
jgi:hypothetical protein